MSNVKKLQIILAGAFIAIAGWNALGQKAVAGNFSHTCSNITLQRGYILRAVCKTRNANYRNTAINLNSGIENRNGYLTRGGGYARSCTNIGWGSGVNLRADCRTYNGDWRATQLNLNHVISNIDGYLRFD